jgi:DNA-binding SARP family transcriptional activator/tetratricopeptide (TPR) repeat protein
MLRVLGSPLVDAGRLPAKAFTLIAMVCLAPSRTMTRSQVATAIWGDNDTPRAAANLRFVLAGIRRWQKENDRQLLRIDGRTVRITSSCEPCDLQIFLDSAPTSDDDVAVLLDFYRGDLLADETEPTFEFSLWLRSQREQLRARFVERLLDKAPSLSDQIAEKAFRHLTKIAPEEERVVRSFLTWLSTRGRPIEANGVLADLEKQLKLDHGVQPSLATKVLANELSLRDYGTSEPPTSTPRAGFPRLLVLPATRASGSNQKLDAVVTLLLWEVVLRLSTMRTFGTIAPHTARQIDEADPTAKARQLGVDYVLTTRLIGTQMAISLIDVETEAILQSDLLPISGGIFERNAEDIARAIAAAIANSELSVFRRTGSASAYVHYLLGNERLRYDLPSLRRARKHFRQTNDLAPHFAPAIALTARSLTYEWLVLGRQDPDHLRASLSLAQQAAEIDPLSALGHWEIGHANLYLQRMDDALEAVQMAKGRAPQIADLLADEADILIHLDRPKAALDAIQAAVALNPIPPDEYLWVQGTIEFTLENYQSAFGVLEQMRDRQPVSRLLAAAAAMTGNDEAARSYRLDWMARYPDFRVADWVKLIPVRNRSFAQRMEHALHRAGFP